MQREAEKGLRKAPRTESESEFEDQPARNSANVTISVRATRWDNPAAFVQVNDRVAEDTGRTEAEDIRFKMGCWYLNFDKTEIFKSSCPRLGPHNGLQPCEAYHDIQTFLKVPSG